VSFEEANTTLQVVNINDGMIDLTRGNHESAGV